MPQLEQNQGLLRDFPTDIAETVNSEFSPLGHTIHHMGRFFAQLVLHEAVDVHNLSRLLALKDKRRAQSKKRSRVAWLVAFCDSLTSQNTFCCILSAGTNELLCVKLLSSFVSKLFAAIHF